MMHSAATDPELRDWLRWASESGKVPVFVRTVAEAVLVTYMPDYELLRPSLLELKRGHLNLTIYAELVLAASRGCRANPRR